MKLTFDFEIPDAAIGFLDPRIERVFFIANNSDISNGAFEGWNLCERDVIVQYNNPIFFDALARYHCHKVQLNTPNHFDSCWGFTANGIPERDFLAQEYCSFTFAVVGSVPGAIRPYFESFQGNAQHMTISNANVPLYATINKANMPQFSYPQGKLPSGGFSSINFFRFLNWIRTRQRCPRLELSTIGFTGIYNSGKPWLGHDFAFEQKIYAVWLDLHKLPVNGSAHALSDLSSLEETP